VVVLPWLIETVAVVSGARGWGGAMAGPERGETGVLVRLPEGGNDMATKMANASLPFDRTDTAN
jgi:hypothetical protein